MLQRLALAGDDLDPANVVALTGCLGSRRRSPCSTSPWGGRTGRRRSGLPVPSRAGPPNAGRALPPHRGSPSIADGAAAWRPSAAAGAGRPALARRRPPGRGGRVAPGRGADRRSRLGAFADALAHLGPLLDHAPDHGDALCLRAEALDALGDTGPRAAYAPRRASSVSRQRRRSGRKQALAQLRRGDPPGGLRDLEGVAPTTVDGRLAQALALSGAAALGFGDPQIGTAKAAEARRLAAAVGRPRRRRRRVVGAGAAAHARGELRDSCEPTCMPRMHCPSWRQRLRRPALHHATAALRGAALPRADRVRRTRSQRRPIGWAPRAGARSR